LGRSGENFVTGFQAAVPSLLVDTSERDIAQHPAVSSGWIKKFHLSISARFIALATPNGRPE
jgi:hypothetical protein